MEFAYNASACAAGGVIQKRNGEVVIIPSLASVALAPTGGEGVTTQRNYESEAVSFSFAETRVFGREVSPNVYTTETDVYITNLRVFDVLSIAMLRATVTSTRTVDPDTDHQDDDHAFDLEASYHGVEVRDSARSRSWQIAPKIDVSVKSLKRYKHLADLIDGRTSATTFVAGDGTSLIPAADKEMLYARFNTDKDGISLRRALTETQPILGTLVEDVEGDDPGLDNSLAYYRHQKLHKVFIPKFGTVRFGELMLKPGRRRLNLLRIQLVDDEVTPLSGIDRPDNESIADFQGGSLAMGSVEGNGSPLRP